MKKQVVDRLVTPQVDTGYENILLSPIMQYDTQSSKPPAKQPKPRKTIALRPKPSSQSSIPILHPNDTPITAFVNGGQSQPQGSARRGGVQANKPTSPVLNPRRLEQYKFRVNPLLPHNYQPLTPESRVETVTPLGRYAPAASQDSNQQEPPKRNDLRLGTVPTVEMLVEKLAETTEKWSATLNELRAAEQELARLKQQKDDKRHVVDEETSTLEAKSAGSTQVQRLFEQLEQEQAANFELQGDIITLQRQVATLTIERQKYLTSATNRHDGDGDDKGDDLHDETDDLHDEVQQLKTDLLLAQAANNDLKEKNMQLMLEKVMLQQTTHAPRQATSEQTDASEIPATAHPMDALDEVNNTILEAIQTIEELPLSPNNGSEAR